MNENKPCDWCPDDTCSSYYAVKVFDKTHSICNCCYMHLRKVLNDKGIETKENIVKNYNKQCKHVGAKR